MDRKYLHGGTMYISENPSDTYTVEDGAVLVYIVPVTDGGNGRRVFLYEAARGETLPSFKYTDYDGQQWAFGLAALDTAVIRINPNSASDGLKDEFAARVNLRGYENEGYEDGLAEYYKLNIVTEDGFIHKTSRERKQAYEDSLNIIYNLFNKRRSEARSGSDPLYGAVEYACEKAHIRIAPIEKVTACCGKKPTVADIAGLSRFACRRVTLQKDWYKTDSGPLIVFDEKTGEPYSCVPRNASRYYIYDPVTGKRTVLTRERAMKISSEAYMIYRPFAEKRMGLKDIAAFAARGIRARDFFRMIILTLVCSVIGLLIPILNQRLYDVYIPLGTSVPLIGACCAVSACLIGNAAFLIVKSLSEFRMRGHIQYDAQSAAYSRLFNLPDSFFGKYDSADIARRVMGVSGFMNSALSALFTAVMSGILSAVYLSAMLWYSAELTAAAVIMTAIYAVIFISLSLRVIKYSKESMELNAKTQSTVYQFINGISKIRAAGIEDRTLYEYLKSYTRECGLNMRSGKISILAKTVSDAAAGLILLTLYYCAVHNGSSISMGSFIAFLSAFGAFFGSVRQIIGIVPGICRQKPIYDRIKPIFENVPERDGTSEPPGDLSGDIEVSNVTFGYDEGSPVVNNLSLHIKEGEYVGIVGPSGCGKSTLLKLLLGFETPWKGKIYYDRKDIERLDKCELRKRIGVVLQDGRLISGSIYDNIAVAAPDMEHVKAAVSAAGLGDDIAMMPMGLHTVVSESGSAISGGQRQRILIARAIAGKPGILFFDEATSSLDNAAQATVRESLDKLKATRVVMAHRLSAVINCDRVIVLDKGAIMEEGSYDELMERRGLFYELAVRQLA